MTRSCDRTLVQSLALEEDRRTSDHDYLQSWIATGPMLFVKRFIDEIYTYWAGEDVINQGGAFHKQEREMSAEAQTEVIVTKGSGDYTSLVGFIDVVCAITCEPNFTGSSNNDYVCDEFKNKGRFRRLVGIEVKSGKGKIDVPLVIRQIGLYKTFASEIHHWVLACRDPQSAESETLLHQAGICCWYLGVNTQDPANISQLASFVSTKDRRWVKR